MVTIGPGVMFKVARITRSSARTSKMANGGHRETRTLHSTRIQTKGRSLMKKTAHRNRLRRPYRWTRESIWPNRTGKTGYKLVLDSAPPAHPVLSTIHLYICKWAGCCQQQSRLSAWPVNAAALHHQRRPTSSQRPPLTVRDSRPLPHARRDQHRGLARSPASS